MPADRAQLWTIRHGDYSRTLRKAKRIWSSSTRVNRLPVELVFVTETRTGAGGKQLFYKLLWVKRTSHDQCCMTTICNFVLRSEGSVAFLSTSKLSEGNPGLVVQLGTSEIISNLSKSFWASDQIHQCPSFSFAADRVAFQFLDLWLGCNCASTSSGWPGLLVRLDMFEIEGFFSICIGLVSSDLLEAFRQPIPRTFSAFSSFTR